MAELTGIPKVAVTALGRQASLLRGAQSVSSSDKSVLTESEIDAFAAFEAHEKVKGVAIFSAKTSLAAYESAMPPL